VGFSDIVGGYTYLTGTQVEENCFHQQFYSAIENATWSSSNTNVETMNAARADAVGPGEATIYADWEGIWYYYGPSLCEPTWIPRQSTASAEVSPPCAYPVNFRQVGPGWDAGGGVLHFDYAWDSSDGILSNLSQCSVGEIVTYDGGSPYSPPSPPFPNVAAANPTAGDDVAGNLGTAQDDHSPGGSFVTPYSSASWAATTQYYRYRCACQRNYPEYVNVMGPLDISRTVSPSLYNYWRYVITKSGSSAYINPLP